MSQFYYMDGLDRLGPFSADTLQTKQLSPQTPVWDDDIKRWKRLQDIPSIYAKVYPHQSHNVGTAEKVPFFKQFKWVFAWCLLNIAALILSYTQLPAFNDTGTPQSEKFWPFVKFTTARFEPISLAPKEIWQTRIHFNGLFTQYDWTEFSFYVGVTIFICSLILVYRKHY